MSYEPMLLIMTVGFFGATQSFDTASLLTLEQPMIISLIPIFLGLLFILTIKLRKSPFDYSYSHHAHRSSSRASRPRWRAAPSPRSRSCTGARRCSSSCGWACSSSGITLSPFVVALAVVALTWFFEVFIDNNSARTKWQFGLKYAWLVALVAGVVNLFYMLITPFI